MHKRVCKGMGVLCGDVGDCKEASEMGEGVSVCVSVRATYTLVPTLTLIHAHTHLHTHSPSASVKTDTCKGEKKFEQKLIVFEQKLLYTTHNLSKTFNKCIFTFYTQFL